MSTCSLPGATPVASQVKRRRLTADHRTISYPCPQCYDITTMKDGKVMWTGHVTVSKDGKSRTVNVNGTDANGKKFTSKAVYDKGRKPEAGDGAVGAGSI